MPGNQAARLQLYIHGIGTGRWQLGTRNWDSHSVRLGVDEKFTSRNLRSGHVAATKRKRVWQPCSSHGSAQRKYTKVNTTAPGPRTPDPGNVQLKIDCVRSSKLHSNARAAASSPYVFVFCLVSGQLLAVKSATCNAANLKDMFIIRVPLNFGLVLERGERKRMTIKLFRQFGKADGRPPAESIPRRCSRRLRCGSLWYRVCESLVDSVELKPKHQNLSGNRNREKP